MAMAMSVSLEQSQEQFEIDQQLQLHGAQEAEGKDPSFNANEDMEEEEEEVALTAAIYASLGQYIIQILYYCNIVCSIILYRLHENYKYNIYIKAFWSHVEQNALKIECSFKRAL